MKPQPKPKPEITAEKLAFLRTNARKGGETLKAKRLAEDPEYYSRIGKLGGVRSKGKPKRRKKPTKPTTVTPPPSLSRQVVLEALDKLG